MTSTDAISAADDNNKEQSDECEEHVMFRETPNKCQEMFRVESNGSANKLEGRNHVVYELLCSIHIRVDLYLINTQYPFACYFTGGFLCDSACIHVGLRLVM